MNGANLIDFLNTLTDEQRTAIIACKTEEEFVQVIDEYDIAITDEMLVGVAGGIGRLLPTFLAGIVIMSGSLLSPAPVKASEAAVKPDTISRSGSSTVSAFETAANLKRGMTFEDNDGIMQVDEVRLVKPGKGASCVNVKVHNIFTGAVSEKQFAPNEKLHIVCIEQRHAVFAYKEEDCYYFLDLESYDILPVNVNKMSDTLRFINEDTECELQLYNGEVINVEVPRFVRLKVVSVAPEVKGNTITISTKLATVETGAEVEVPLYISHGDNIKIDTLTGKFIERC